MGNINGLVKLANQIAKDGNRQLGNLQMPHAKRMIKNSIRRFYGAYRPQEYRRRYSLYQMIKPVISDTGFKIQMSGELANIQHRVDNNYIYVNSYQHGYHGGAISGEGHPDPGTPYWRTPEPDYPHWGGPAVPTKAPDIIFRTWWNNFVKRNSGPFKTVVLRRLVKTYGEQLSQYIYE